MFKKSVIFALVGSVMLVVVLVVNEWTLVLFTEDGQIDSSSQLLILRAFDIAFLAIGIFVIGFRNREWMANLFISGIATILAIVALDYALYFSAPLLPANLASMMSPNAQVRFLRQNPDATEWVYDNEIRYGKPNSEATFFGDLVQQVDRLGFNNPQGYIEGQTKIDILLVGDYFIWGTEEVTMADYLRNILPQQSVYSVGVSGTSISHWRHYIRHFIESNPSGSNPEVIVLNFYSGNDVDDTNVYLALQDENGSTLADQYFSFINFAFLVPEPGGSSNNIKLPELFYISSNLLYRPGETETPMVMVEGVEMPLFATGFEPIYLSDAFLAEITLTVQEIRELSPDTNIILSYLPTARAIYGNALIDCLDCELEQDLQQEISDQLRIHADTLDINYLDSTERLQEIGQTELLWSENDHFSPEGYDYYAQFLADEIEQNHAQE